MREAATQAPELVEQSPAPGYGLILGQQAAPLSRLMGRMAATHGNQTSRTWPLGS